MFICLFVCLFVNWFFCFSYINHLGTPTGNYPENFVKIRHDLAEILRITKLDWKCLFVCLVVCLFVDLFVFCFNHRNIPTGSFPQNIVKIQLDLAEILRISKLDWRDGGGKKGRRRRRRGGILLCNGLMFIWLFVCLFVSLLTVFFILIILGHPQEVTLKILRISDWIWLRYLGSNKLGQYYGMEKRREEGEGRIPTV